MAEVTTESAAITSETTEKTNADATGAETSTATNEGVEKTFTQADIDRIIVREKKSAVAAALKAEADKKADAEKGEAQKQQERADEAEAKAQQAEDRIRGFVVRNAVQSAAADPKLNARDAGAIALLVRSEALSVEGEEVSGIEAELKRIKTAHPALFYSTQADGAAQGSSGELDFNAEIRRKVGRG